MRALVIGADGFAGRWLVRHLRESGDRVAALVGPRFEPPLEDVADVRVADVRDAEAITAAVASSAPDAVYLLAGVSGRETREDLDAAVGVSVIGSMNTLLACSHLLSPPRLLFVSTGYVYRAARSAVDEDAELAPASTYAAAKLAAERALLTLSDAVGVEIVVARAFNHIGPGQRDSFVVPTVARQIAAAIRSGDAVARVRIRDGTQVRDFSDVRDVVRAYRLLVAHGAPGAVYNVASGRAASIGELAAIMGEAGGVSVAVESTEAASSTDRSVLIGDASRLRGLGWQPEHQLEGTLRDTLADIRDDRR